MLTLYPRLNYKYSVKDATISFAGLFKKSFSIKPLQDIFNSKNIVFTYHARTGLRIVLNSMGLPPNASIGVQAYNCFTVFTAIKKAGYKPVFIDIIDEFQLDLNDLEKKKDLFDALIVTHLFGIPADIDKIRAIIPKKPLIEDCAHGFLSKYKNKYVGTLGDIGIFSIGKAKFPSVGAGGFIIINNTKYVKTIQSKIQQLNENSIVSEIKSILFSLFLSFLHNPFIYFLLTFPVLKKINAKKDFGGNFRFEEKQILHVNKYLFIKRLSKFFSLKKFQCENAKGLKTYYNLNQINDHLFENDYESNFFMVPTLVSNRDQFIKAHYKKGVEIGSHFNQSIKWASQFGYFKGDCKNTEKIIRKAVTIPTYYRLRFLNFNNKI